MYCGRPTHPAPVVGIFYSSPPTTDGPCSRMGERAGCGTRSTTGDHEIDGSSALVVRRGLQPAQPAPGGWAANNTFRETPIRTKHMCVLGPTTGAGWVGRPQHMQRDAFLH